MSCVLWIEAPVFEFHSISEGIGRKAIKMGHNKRFRDSKELSAVIISFPGTTCILKINIPIKFYHVYFGSLCQS